MEEQSELRLLTDWNETGYRFRWREAAAGSILVHILLIVLLVSLPESAFIPPRTFEVRQRITPLVAPLMEPTQKDPNKGKINRNFTADSLIPRPEIQIPKGAPSTTRPKAPRPGLPVPPPVQTAEIRPPDVTPPANQAPDPLAELPKQLPPPVAPPPQIEVQEPPPEKPKLAFEPVPAAPTGVPKPGSKLPTPGVSVEDAMRAIAAQRTPSGGVMVGDIGSGPGGIGGGVNLPPSPGQVKSNLELLSDPMGVDFRPYLVRVLTNVRKNWFAIMPESAKLGRRGRVSIQFAIDREGGVPKLVIAAPSGTDALDRAAVAGISASNPFPPLPTEYRGSQIRLQFVFSYNMPSN
jgi:TonB family protein